MSISALLGDKMQCVHFSTCWHFKRVCALFCTPKLWVPSQKHTCTDTRRVYVGVLRSRPGMLTAQSEFSQLSCPFQRQLAIAADLFHFTLVPQRTSLVRNWLSHFFRLVFSVQNLISVRKSPLVVSKTCFSHAKAVPLTTSEVSVSFPAAFARCSPGDPYLALSVDKSEGFLRDDCVPHGCHRRASPRGSRWRIPMVDAWPPTCFRG